MGKPCFNADEALITAPFNCFSQEPFQKSVTVTASMATPGNEASTQYRLCNYRHCQQGETEKQHCEITLAFGCIKCCSVLLQSAFVSLTTMDHVVKQFVDQRYHPWLIAASRKMQRSFSSLSAPSVMPQYGFWCSARICLGFFSPSVLRGHEGIQSRWSDTKASEGER